MPLALRIIQMARVGLTQISHLVIACKLDPHLLFIRSLSFISTDEFSS